MHYAHHSHTSMTSHHLIIQSTSFQELREDEGLGESHTSNFYIKYGSGLVRGKEMRIL